MTNHKKAELEDKLKKIKAVDIMSKFAITITEDKTVDNLAHLMMRFKISGVPVVSKNGKICGIVTATDLFNLMKKLTIDIKQNTDLIDYHDLHVGALMTTEVVSITEDTNLYEIIKIMCSKDIHTLPVMVMEKEEIVGVIGRRDILNACYVMSID